jgi:hypothetical protein
VDVALLDDLLGFIGRQNGFGQAHAEPGQFQFTRRIMQDVMMPRHPLKPHAQRHDAVVLAGEAQRFAALLAVMEHAPLIGFEHRARHLHRLREAAFVSPIEKEADVHAAVLHRVFGVVGPAVYRYGF